MRIAIAGPISVKGVSRFLEDSDEPLPVGNDGAPLLTTLIMALMERGHEVSAYTLDKGMARQGAQLYTAMGVNGFRLYVGPYRNHSFRPNGGKPGRMVDVFRHERQALQKIIGLDRPDIIHAHWTYEYAMAALASGLPYVITAHDSPVQVLRYMPNMYRLGRYFMARSVYRRARVLTAVSPYLKDQVQRYAKTEIQVIGNPVPYQTLKTCITPRMEQRDINRPRIAMVLNGWGGRKNASAGLMSFSLLRRSYKHARLYCFGHDYGENEEAAAWAKSQGVAEGVEFVGSTPHDNLIARLPEMNLLLHPALEESCPLTLLEAMAVGVPVIGGDKSGGVPWVLDQGRAGVLADVNSPEEMCNSMKHLLSDHDVYKNIVVNAKQRVEKYFSPKAVVKQYEDCYLQVLRGAM